MNTCRTCHWWFRFHDDDPEWGRCVWHTGTKGTKVQQVKFHGSILVKHNFGCVKWAEDKRDCVAVPTELPASLD